MAHGRSWALALAFVVAVCSVGVGYLLASVTL